MKVLKFKNLKKQATYQVSQRIFKLKPHSLSNTIRKQLMISIKHKNQIIC